MTYFDPEIYNKHNLKEKDRLEIEFYGNLIENAILNTEDHFELHADKENPISVGIMQYKLAAMEDLEDNLAMSLHDIVVSMIDNYDEEEFEMLRMRGDSERKEKGIQYKTPIDAAYELMGIEVEED